VLDVLACNPANFPHTLATREPIKDSSTTSLVQKLLKIMVVMSLSDGRSRHLE
jgi:hypothetical protein